MKLSKIEEILESFTSSVDFKDGKYEVLSLLKSFIKSCVIIIKQVKVV